MGNSANIILSGMPGVQPPKDYNDIVSEGLARQHGRNVNQLFSRQMAAEDASANRLAGQQAIRLQNVDQSTGKLNQEGYRKGLELGGYGAEADASGDEQHLRAVKQLEGNVKLVEYASHGIAQGLADPASWPGIHAHLQEVNTQLNGPDASPLQIPETADIPALQAAYEASISAKDKGMMNLEEAKNNYALQKDKQAQQNWQATHNENVRAHNLTADAANWTTTVDNQGMPVLTHGKKEGMPVYSPTGIKNVVISEDERKAAGWLTQAGNAYGNMLKVVSSNPEAQAPGLGEAMVNAVVPSLKGAVQSPDRQKFDQAVSALSDPLLRAATGAGMNIQEAQRKIDEISPKYFDKPEVRKQKLEAIPVFIESLKTRSGRALPPNYQVPQTPKQDYSSHPRYSEYLKAIGGQ